MRRRTLLVGLGVTATAGVTGFTTGNLPGTPVDDAGTDVVRCRGDPISVERSVTDAPGFDTDNIQYHPENSTVRYVKYQSGGEPVAFGTMSFERWGSTECAEAALERVRAVTAERLGTEAFGSGMGDPPGFRLPSGFHTWQPPAVKLHVGTVGEPDGPGSSESSGSSESGSTPSISVSELADAAPRSVAATVSLDGDSYSRTVPVFARRMDLVQA